MLSIFHFSEPASMFHFTGNNIPYLEKDLIPRKMDREKKTQWKILKAVTGMGESWRY